MAGSNQFQAFITSTLGGVEKKEYTNLGATTLPDPFTGYSFNSAVREPGRVTRMIFQFTNTRYIPAGYDTDVGITDPLQKAPIG